MTAFLSRPCYQLLHGRMRTPWHWLALAAALLALCKDVVANMGYWSPIPITTAIFFGLNFLSLFLLLIAVVADYRLTPGGGRRQQFKPIITGPAVWIFFFSLGMATDQFAKPLFSGGGIQAWPTLIEWAGYSVA